MSADSTRRTPANSLERLVVLALVSLVAMLALPAIAGAAGPAPIDGADPGTGEPIPTALSGMLGDAPSVGVTGMLSTDSSASQRHAFGLPSLKELIGKGWKKAATKADEKFAAKLDASVKPAVQQLRAGVGSAAGDFDRMFKAQDAVKGPHGKQTRKLKVAATLSGGCPQLNELATGYGWQGSGRAVYEVTTTERVGRYDVVTAVVMDGSFRSRPGMLSNATADDFSVADYGEIAITRNQVAIDRKTGKRSKLGVTERFTSTLDPFYKPEGNFEAFVASQDDENPAPPRTLKTDTWERAAAWFMTIPYDAMRSRVLEAEKLAQTPNACVKVSVDAPSALSPGQTIQLTGVPHLTDGDVNPFFILQFASGIKAEWINMQGQSAQPLGAMHQLWSGNPWYSFTAPPTAWPASAPAGLAFTLYSEAGVASEPVSFQPLDDELHFKVLDMTGTVDATNVKTVDNQCTFTGGHQHIDLGFAGSPSSAPDGNLSGDFGSIHAPITHVTQPYSTLLSCPTSDTPCDFGTESLPNGQLGINLQRNEDQMELDWAFVPVQLGDSRCSLQVPDIYVDRSLLINSYPVMKFQGNAPFTVENHGSQDYSVTQGISTMSGTLNWSFQMTLRRVDENGQTLG